MFSIRQPFRYHNYLRAVRVRNCRLFLENIYKDGWGGGIAHNCRPFIQSIRTHLYVDSVLVFVLIICNSQRPTRFLKPVFGKIRKSLALFSIYAITCAIIVSQFVVVRCLRRRRRRRISHSMNGSTLDRCMRFVCVVVSNCTFYYHYCGCLAASDALHRFVTTMMPTMRPYYYCLCCYCR